MCWSRYINVIEPVCYMEGAYFGGANGGWTEPSNEVRGTEGISDTLIKTIHRHTLSVGIDMQHQRAVEDAANYPADAIISFGGGYTGSGLADWLLGYMSSFEQGAGELADIQGWQVDPYVNDEYRVKPGLTLTLGVRWDPDLAPVSVGGRGAAFVAGQQSVIFPAAPTGLVFPGDPGVNARASSQQQAILRAPHRRGLPAPEHAPYFVPRGIRLVHRSGALLRLQPRRRYRALCHGPRASCAIATFPSARRAEARCLHTEHRSGHRRIRRTSTTRGKPRRSGPMAKQSRSRRLPRSLYKPPSNSLIPGPVYEQDSFSRNFREGVTQAWNASIEQQLSNVMAVRVAYVGSESYHQSYVQDDNFAGYSYCTSYTSLACPTPANAARACCSVLQLQWHSGIRQRRNRELPLAAGNVPAEYGAWSPGTVQLYLAEDHGRGQCRQHRCQPGRDR